MMRISWKCGLKVEVRVVDVLGVVAGVEILIEIREWAKLAKEYRDK